MVLEQQRGNGKPYTDLKPNMFPVVFNLINLYPLKRMKPKIKILPSDSLPSITPTHTAGQRRTYVREKQKKTHKETERQTRKEERERRGKETG